MTIPEQDILEVMQPGSVASKAHIHICQLCNSTNRSGLFTMPNGVTVMKHQRDLGYGTLEQTICYEPEVSPYYGTPYSESWDLVSPISKKRMPMTKAQYDNSLASHNKVLYSLLVN